MLYCNLAGLMANKKVNISDVNKSTKISRTTLTALYYNHTKGIQLDTANELCKYFDVTLDKIFLFSKYDFNIAMVHYGEPFINENKAQVSPSTITLQVEHGKKKEYCDFGIVIFFHYTERAVELSADLEYYICSDDTLNEKNNLLKKLFSSFSDEFRAYFLNMVQNEIEGYYDEHNELETEDGKPLPVKCVSITSGLW